MVTNQVATRSPSVGVGCGAASSRGDARSLSDARPPAISLPRRACELFGWDALCSVSACLRTCEGLPPLQDMRAAAANRVLSWTTGNNIVVDSFYHFQIIWLSFLFLWTCYTFGRTRLMGNRPIASCLPRQKMWIDFQASDIRVRDLKGLAPPTETISS